MGFTNKRITFYSNGMYHYIMILVVLTSLTRKNQSELHISDLIISWDDSKYKLDLLYLVDRLNKSCENNKIP